MPVINGLGCDTSDGRLTIDDSVADRIAYEETFQAEPVTVLKPAHNAGRSQAIGEGVRELPLQSQPEEIITC
ncbi:MAG: hypothetical protein ABGZ53_11675 [Fuerstiella sp.]